MTHHAPPFVSGARPFFGHALEFRSDPIGLLQRGRREHGDIFAYRLVKQPVAVVVGPEYQKQFFTQTDKALGIQKPYRFLNALFGEVLFMASPEAYLAQRPFITHAFRRQKMLQYVDLMAEETQKWLDTLGESGTVNITDAMLSLTQAIAGRALLGEAFQESVGDEFWELYKDLGRAMDPLLPPHWPLPKFRRRDRARARMLDILRPVIAERRRNPEAYDDFLQEFVDQRYKDGRPIEDELLTNLILGLMFAGHETTAGQAAWTIIQLAQHPDYLARVRAELGAALPPGAPLDAAALRQLQHLAWAVREVERLYPSAEMSLRTVDEDFPVGDYCLPAGWLVQVTAALAHRLPSLFSEPDRFDPLRFAPDRGEGKDRFALIGFGGGLHKCTGMNFANNEMMVIAALLAQQFDIALLSSKPEVDRGLGASRPTPTWLYYKKRPALSPGLGAAVREDAPAATTCPAQGSGAAVREDTRVATPSTDPGLGAAVSEGTRVARPSADLCPVTGAQLPAATVSERF